MKRTVLVLGVGGNVSQGILKALALCEPRWRVVGACVSPLSAGLHRVDRAYLSPHADEPGFIEWVIEVCQREQVSAVLSGVDAVLAALAQAAAQIRERSGAVCIVSPPEVLQVGLDKLAGMRWLERNGFPHPRYAHAADFEALAALSPPLIAKPRRGGGARGVVMVEDPEELAGRDDLIVQELLEEEEEYTVGCFCDRDGRLRGSVAMRRELRDGTTFRAELGSFAPAREVGERIVERLRPLGPCNVQLRGTTPFELNVRFSGTTPMRARLGFREVEEALRHFVLGEPARELERPTEGVVLRYWNEIYVPAAQPGTLSQREGLDAPEGLVEDWGM